MCRCTRPRGSRRGACGGASRGGCLTLFATRGGPRRLVLVAGQGPLGGRAPPAAPDDTQGVMRARARDFCIAETDLDFFAFGCATRCRARAGPAAPPAPHMPAPSARGAPLWSVAVALLLLHGVGGIRHFNDLLITPTQPLIDREVLYTADDAPGFGSNKSLLTVDIEYKLYDDIMQRPPRSHLRREDPASVPVNGLSVIVYFYEQLSAVSVSRTVEGQIYVDFCCSSAVQSECAFPHRTARTAPYRSLAPLFAQTASRVPSAAPSHQT